MFLGLKKAEFIGYVSGCRLIKESTRQARQAGAHLPEGIRNGFGLCLFHATYSDVSSPCSLSRQKTRPVTAIRQVGIVYLSGTELKSVRSMCRLGTRRQVSTPSRDTGFQSETTVKTMDRDDGPLSLCLARRWNNGVIELRGCRTLSSTFVFRRI